MSTRLSFFLSYSRTFCIKPGNTKTLTHILQYTPYIHLTYTRLHHNLTYTFMPVPVVKQNIDHLLTDRKDTILFCAAYDSYQPCFKTTCINNNNILILSLHNLRILGAIHVVYKQIANRFAINSTHLNVTLMCLVLRLFCHGD